MHTTRIAKNILLALAVVAAAGCGSAPTATSEEVAQTSQPLTTAAEPIAIPSNWVGTQLGIAPPTLTPIGKVNIVAPPPGWQADIVTVVPAIGPASPLDSKPVAVTSDGTLYGLQLSASDMKAIGSYMTARGLNGASGPEMSGNLSKGWPNGVDDRSLWSYNSAPNDYPRRTIGNLYTTTSSGYTDCSATLFSGELILTAAHCLFSSPGSLAWPDAFYPGIDDTTVPYGNYGFTHAWYETAWTNNNCSGSTYSSTCEMYDWAVLKLNTTLNIGWMGLASNTDSVVAGWYQYSAGYPNCSASGTPVGCEGWENWLASGCQIGSFFNLDTSCDLVSCANANRNYNFGCATSSGDSGGPLFSYSPGSAGPYIVAEAVHDACTGSSCGGNNTPNQAVRLDGTLYTFMVSLKSMYP